MNKAVFAGLAALALMAPAYAESLGESTGVNSVLGVAPKTQDFVTEVATSDMFELQSSQLAEGKGDAQAKDFAAHMLHDHQMTTDQLKALVASGKVNMTLPTALDSSHQAMLDKLKGLNGGEFDKQYASDQLSGHKDAVSLFQRYAKGGDNADLKAWAAEVLPTLEHHLEMAKALDDKAS